MVSKARLDLPDPDSPVNTISESLGRSSDTSLRLCSRAPRTTRRSATAVRFPGHEVLTPTGDTSSYPGPLTKHPARGAHADGPSGRSPGAIPALPATIERPPRFPESTGPPHRPRHLRGAAS